jgi:U3 small nucleolar ribonucleoprotein component
MPNSYEGFMVKVAQEERDSAQEEIIVLLDKISSLEADSVVLRARVEELEKELIPHRGNKADG